MMDNIYLQYAPIILLVISWCVTYNIFITPAKLDKVLKERAEVCNGICKDSYTTREDMQIERKELLLEVERRFLEKVAFEQFTKRFEDNFKTMNRTLEKLVENQEHIKDVIIKRGL